MVRHCEFCYAAVPADYTTCPVCGGALRASRGEPGPPAPPGGQSATPMSAAPRRLSHFHRSEFSKKSSFSLSRTLRLGFVLMLFLFLTGLGLLIYGGIYHPAQLRAGATATVSAALTALTQSTAQAHAHATATAITQAHATATAAAQATVVAAATVTAQQATYTAATQGAPTLVDPLTGQNGNLWTLDSNLREGCLFSGSSLHSIVSSDHVFVPCLALATSFANFTLQVHMRLARGDGGGLVFRANAGSGTGYLFFVGSDGNYSLMLSDGTQANALVGGPTPAIHTAPGQDNLLTVIARGSSILLYVNKQYVGSAQDTSFSTGQIGVFAIDLGHVTDAAFSQLQVWSR
ncbi:LamG-like jellyroll fold domain-containing protein [Thermogemmatispora onikobensis]|uniref:LamG-like jellyroll fold domain-containing protein n=1 Tax=Thermogemmatispora onikobensis TaxID=732234 RepID=UPI00114D2621|nr:LamG-like jellyroll fold domain-containing protein [Thermogemmatispora onikobensis]